MLYSVRERTKEIGTLKAMGASNGTILGQFMLEGILLSLIAAGYRHSNRYLRSANISQPATAHASANRGQHRIGPNGTMYLTTRWRLGKNSHSPRHETNCFAAPITPQTMLLGLGAAVLLGALGSLYPALKAARTKPAEAMRYE